MCVEGGCRLPELPGYSFGPSPQPFIDACAASGHATVLANADDATARVIVPFEFAFWGRPVTTGWVSSNGVLEFSTLPNSVGANRCLPSAGPYLSVLGFWDDLETRSGICVATVGEAGARSFVVEWNDATFSGVADAHLTFEIVLHEGSDLIDVVYASMREDPRAPVRANGVSATIGVQGSAGSARQIACNVASVMAPGAYRFAPR